MFICLSAYLDAWMFVFVICGHEWEIGTEAYVHINILEFREAFREMHSSNKQKLDCLLVIRYNNYILRK